MKIKGKDYGAYTVVDPDEVEPGFETDFSIVGFGWGKNKNPTWDRNKPYVMDFYRKLLYQVFYNIHGWTAQADFILEVLHEVKAQAFFLDAERSQWGLREDLNMRQQSLDIERILNYVVENFDGKVGLYSNFYDYYIISKHVNLSAYPWWAADPDRHKDDHPGSIKNWNRWAGNRTLHDYHFDQWNWKGHAPSYGAINGKFEMDLTQLPEGLVTLDAWLGLGEAPPDPPPDEDCTDDYNSALADFYGKITEAKDELERE